MECTMLWLRRFAVLALFLLSVPSFAAAQTAKDKDKEPETVSYYKDVRPIFQQHCQGCHQPAKAGGGYVMSGFADLFKKTDHEVPGIVASQPGKSEVIKQITTQQGKPPQMPRGKDP